MYKIRPERTPPQGLLMAIYILVFVILALNVVIFSLTPVYTMYGNQHYRAKVILIPTAMIQTHHLFAKC